MLFSTAKAGELYQVVGFNKEFFVDVESIGLKRGSLLFVEEAHENGPIRFRIQQRRVTMTLGACKMIEVEEIK